MPLAYEQETFLLRKCFFEVQNEIGRGWSEECYRHGCVLWFAEHQLPVVCGVPRQLTLRGAEVHCVVTDFVGWDAISVILKAVPRHFGRADFVPLFDSLKCRGDRVGLLVNMGLDRVEIERIVSDPPMPTWIENWQSWTDRIEGDDRAVGAAVREALRGVYAEHTTGYGEEVFGRLLSCALHQQGLAFVAEPVARARYREFELEDSTLNCVIIDSRIVIAWSALFDTNDFNANRCRSYLKALGLRWGIAVDFGKTRAEVIGIRHGD